MKRRGIAIGIALLCVANVASEASTSNLMGTAAAPSTCCSQHFFVKEGDVYKMTRNQCPKAQGSNVVCVAAAVLAPGNLIVWPEKDAQEPMFHALTYAGIQDNDIVLTRDTGPSIRLPIKGIFTKYGILDIEGQRIVLDIVYPDKIKAKVRFYAKRCRCR